MQIKSCKKSITQNFRIVRKWKLAIKDFLNKKYLKQLDKIGKGKGLTFWMKLDPYA
jgi:hypothetical protein